MILEDHSSPVDEASRTVRSVLVVDDHSTFADLLAMAIDAQPDFRCVGTATTAAAGQHLARTLRPDLIALDIELGAESGLDTVAALRALVPGVGIVVVTAHRDLGWVSRAVEAGADGFVSKLGPLEELLDVLRRIERGSVAVGPTTMRRPTRSVAAATAGTPALSAREAEVLALLSQGLAPGEIAPMLNINLSTCRGYLKAIHLKLGVRSQVQAVLAAQRLGLVDSVKAH